MGFSLEPHQAAYETALESKFSVQAEVLAPESVESLEAYNALVTAYEDAFLQKDTAAALEAVAVSPEAEEQGVLKALALSFAAEEITAIESFKNAISFSSTLFWCMAFMVGTVQGGIQAVSRSYFSKLVPKDRSNEYFGFFDIFGKFASVIGPVLYSFVGGLTGRSSLGVLGLIILFLVGLVILIGGRKHLEALEQTAGAAAE
ncbi:MAG: MFS transporter [Clostridia bacterium]|nr:MFS transporter [Clostridia bacterium]